jgi:tRNA(adenine34) deaminase
MDDTDYMRLAIAEASQTGDDVPVGAIVVAPDGEIIGRGRNRREATGDPTAHAEIEALRAAAQKLGHWRVHATLYVTQEPCPMCAGALVNSRILRLVYGCENPKAGAVHTLYTIPTDPRRNHTMTVVGGILAEDCAALLKTFFLKLRERWQSG